jgi:ABC transporter substrate binding protein
MRRREIIWLLGGAATWPLAARAQNQTKIPRIGIIDDSPRWNAFRYALRDLGYLEGQNIAFEYAYGDGMPDRLAEAAAQLVRRPVDVIATYGTAASFAAKQATTTIPIVMISVGDPVRAGLVTSLAHPGGNVTGNTILPRRPSLTALTGRTLRAAGPSQRPIAASSNSRRCASRDSDSCGTVGITPAMMERMASKRSVFLFWRQRSSRRSHSWAVLGSSLVGPGRRM